MVSHSISIWQRSSNAENMNTLRIARTVARGRAFVNISATLRRDRQQAKTAQHVSGVSHARTGACNNIALLAAWAAPPPKMLTRPLQRAP